MCMLLELRDAKYRKETWFKKAMESSHLSGNVRHPVHVTKEGAMEPGLQRDHQSFIHLDKREWPGPINDDGECHPCSRNRNRMHSDSNQTPCLKVSAVSLSWRTVLSEEAQVKKSRSYEIIFEEGIRINPFMDGQVTESLVVIVCFSFFK